jgi:hypothetical protein
MNYKDEFERLLDVAEQALTGIDFANRQVLAFAPLGVLKSAVDHYREMVAHEPEVSIPSEPFMFCDSCHQPMEKTLHDAYGETELFICRRCGTQIGRGIN